MEIACPADCPYLTSAREHPPAAALRRQQDDLGLIVPFMRDLNHGQSRLFFLLLTFLSRYPSPDLQPLIDEDAVDAAASLAATYETAARGVIYDHPPQSMPAARLVAELTPVLAEVGRGGGAAFERDAAVVLRRIEAAARQRLAAAPASRRAFLDLLGRVIRSQERAERSAETPTEDTPRVIIP